MSKHSIFFLVCFITTIVVNASGLDDFSNNLASDLGPLLSLLGDAATIQYLSENTRLIDYFIFAMAPIGIISTITAVIRICGSSALRAFIGRSQEGESIAEAELCTSTSADVCEKFDKGGITRVLGRPDIIELIYFSNAPKDGESNLHLFTRYLEGDEEDIDWFKVPNGKKSAWKFAPKPNISLNVGIKRRQIQGHRSLEIKRSTPFVCSDETKPLQTWTSSTQNSQKRYSGTFIAVSLVVLGYIAQFIGLRGLDAWISIAQLAITLVMSILRGALRMQRLSKSDNLIQPIFENDKLLAEWDDLVAGHELDWLAVEVSKEKKPEKKSSKRCAFQNYVLEKNVTEEELEEEREEEALEKKSRNNYTWHITGQHENATIVKDPNSEDRTKKSLLFENRVRLSQLTGHNTTLNIKELDDSQNWKDNRVKVRNKIKHLGAAISEAAAILLHDPTTKTPICLKTSSKNFRDDVLNGRQLGQYLPLAAQNKWPEVISTLLEMGENLDITDEDDRTAASYCAEFGQELPLQQLIDMGANLDIADKKDLTPLVFAIKNGHENIVKQLLRTNKVDCNRRMYNGRNALWFAVERNSINIMESLLDNGDGVEENDYRIPPLFLAANSGYKKAAELLITRGAAIDVQHSSQTTLLMWAIWRGHTDIVKLLVQALTKTLVMTQLTKDQVSEAESLLGPGSQIRPLRNHSDGFCSTLDIRPRSTPGQTDLFRIAFNPIYSEPPCIMLGISAISRKMDSDSRVQWKASNVTASELELKNTSTNGTNSDGESGSVVWLEFGPDEEDFQVGKSYYLADTEEQIQFEQPYKKAPNVIVWFSGLEFLDQEGCSFYASIGTIQPASFKLQYSKQKVSVTWLAFPSEGKRIRKGHGKCTQDSDCVLFNGRYYIKEIVEKFEETFERTPRIFVAINKIKMESGKRIDITVKISKQSTTGFTWICSAPLHADVEVDWIAFG
ncbi:hypothetical protein GGI43DRAFT_427958 [Trichoderma evansii]